MTQLRAMDGALIAVIGGTLVVGVCLWLSLRYRRRERLLRDLPTSKVQGVFIGTVEVKGTAESSSPFTGYLRSEPCVHYAWSVEEHWSRTVTETYTDKDGKTRTRTRTESGWTTVANGGESGDFYLQDDTGALRINPVDATLETSTWFDETVSLGHPLYFQKGPPGAIAHSTHRRRFTEEAIPLHAELYVVGRARERDDAVAPEIAASPEQALFLISMRSEERVRTSFARKSWCAWAVGLLLCLVPLILFVVSDDPSLLRVPPWALAVPPVVFVGLWAAGWLWMVFNSLIELRQRVRQGWSLIDVELKRRSDLLPGLVATVSAGREHERATQTALAALRAQLAATPPGQAGPDHAGVAPVLRAVIEAYPELGAQAGFAALQRQLIETEQRIALARAYYNDIATHLATRLEQVPDRFVGRLAGLRPEPLLQAAEFERAPLTVSFER